MMEFNLEKLKELERWTDESHFYYPPVLVKRWREGFEKELLSLMQRWAKDEQLPICCEGTLIGIAKEILGEQ